jgi:hypothetical protein
LKTIPKQNGRIVPEIPTFATQFEQESSPARLAMGEHVLYVSIATIQPEEAQYILDAHNTANRKKKPSHASHLAKSMQLDHWCLTGEAVIFDENETLQNGQHRLMGCVESDKPFTTLVVRGSDPKAFAYMDQTSRRGTADVLGISGVENRNTVAAAAAHLARHEAGLLGAANMAFHRLATNEVLGVVARYPELHEAANIGMNSRRVISKTAATTALYVLFSRINQAEAVRFFHDLASGASLAPGDPILALRNRMLSNTANAAKLTTRHVLALVIKAWNARRKGQSLRVLIWREDENFPEIV